MTRNSLSKLVWVAALLVACPLSSPSQEIDLENLPLEVERIPVSIPGALSGFTRACHPSLGLALRLLPDGEREGFFICRLRKRRRTPDGPDTARRP